jgi:hypothetical protein
MRKARPNVLGVVTPTLQEMCTPVAAKTTSERVAKLRADRDALGLKRRELYAHDDDWAQIVKLAMRLQMKRTKAAAKQKAP